MNVPVPLDHFPVNALTSKVFSFMVKKGKHFSGKVTPLFASMLVQPTEDEGATSKRPSEPQPTPFPPHPSEASVEPQSDPSPRPLPSTHIPDSIPESSGGNHGVVGEECFLKQSIGTEEVLEETVRTAKELCPKQEEETQRFVVHEEKEREEKEVSTEDVVIVRTESEKMARKVQEDWEAEEEFKKLAEKEAIKTALSNETKRLLQYEITYYKTLSSRIANDAYLKHVGKQENTQTLKKQLEDLQAIYEESEKKILKKRVAKETSKKEDTAKVPAKVSSPDRDYLVIYRANGNFRAFNCLLERLYEACGVYILELIDGTFINMLVERRYPLSKDLLQRMLDLRLEVERESTAALDLIRFIKQQIDEE
ncbi:hypothetical protein Tco_0618131 [Tanacetum coccineum]